MQKGALTVAAVAVVVAGCGPVDAGSDAAQEFTEHINHRYGGQVRQVRVTADNSLPFHGASSGSVVLSPDTSPEVFSKVLDDVRTFRPEHGDFDGVGVEANGVGVCVGDPQLRQKQALRDVLHAFDVSLSGEWPCPSSSHEDRSPTEARSPTWTPTP